MMGSLSGIIQRPLVAAAAVAAASVSIDLPDRHYSPSKSTNHDPNSSLASHISASKLSRFSFVTKIRVPFPDIKQHLVPNLGCDFSRSSLSSCAISSLLLKDLYRSAELAKPPNTNAFTTTLATAASQPEALYRWHLPEPSAIDVSGCSKSRTVVVLLGWLGAKQKHLKKYAEWYTSMGFHAITFTFPMFDIMSYQVGGKAEQDIELLVNHLVDWIDEEEEHGKNLVFHTFSNTGWLTYGAILEKFQEQNSSLMGSIKGCIVDSAPVAAPDPQVWASGFSAAFLKKRSAATKGFAPSNGSCTESVAREVILDSKPAVAEAALLLVLEKFFAVVLNLPSVNRRLSDVMNLLSSRQPKCPQLYIYSSADRVIPSGSVEAFIEEQRRLGVEVKACNFISTPHVDHFRNDPQLYTSQLTRFLEDSVLSRCRRSRSDS